MVIAAATLTFEPLISSTLWLTLAAVSVLVALAYALRRPASISRTRWFSALALSSAGWAGVLTVLLNPTWLEQIPPPAGRPLLTVLLDESASMSTADVEGQTRYAAGRKIADQVFRDLAATFDLQLKTFADQSHPADVTGLAATEPAGKLTDLATALQESMAWDRPQGQAILLLSDGIHNGPGGLDPVLEAARSAKAMSIPVSVTPLGGAGNLDDIAVTLPRPQELAYAGQKLQIPVRVRQRGRLGDQFELTLKDKDGEVGRQMVRVGPDGEVATTFEILARRPGVFRYEVSATSARPETVTGNNTGTLVVRVSGQPIRVLVLEGKPYWDTKFLLRTLSADAMLEVDALTRLAGERFLRRELRLKAAAPAETPAAEPAEGDLPGFERTDESSVVEGLAESTLSAATLAGYQVIVLGRDADIFLSAPVVDRLRNWIARDGGSLVCFRGAPVSELSQQLASIMPVRWSPGAESRFHPRLTDRGLAADWLATTGSSDGGELARLPSLVMQAQPGRPSPLAVVLASSGDMAGPPVVTYQPYGAGRAVTVEGAGMWRWAFLSPQHRERDEVYGGLWQSLIRWLVSSVGLAPGQDLLLRTDRVTYRVGEAVSMQVLAREDVWPTLPPLQLYRNDELLADRFMASPVGDEPGVFQVNLGRLPEGRYQARVAGGDPTSQQQSAAFDVLPFLNEQLDIAARPDILARIAQETDGAVLKEVSAGDFTRKYQEHVSRARPDQTRRYSAWDRWWALAAILAAWCAGWTVRRMGGLV